MKSFLKTFAIVLAALLLTLVGWTAAMALGWTTVPPLITDQIAKAKGLSPAEALELNRTVNLYSTLRKSPDAPVLDKALKMVTEGKTDQEAWLKFAQEAYPQLNPATLTAIRDQLQIAPDDFEAVKGIFDSQVKRLGQGKPLQLSDDQAQLLTDFDAKYHLVETFSKFR